MEPSFGRAAATDLVTILQLTGLLRKAPANTGFYRSFAGRLVLIAAPPIGVVSLEPLGAGARPSRAGRAGFAPCRVVELGSRDRCARGVP
jgi:hypothetical protein